MTGMLAVTTTIDGIDHGHDDVRAWELTRARTALALLKERLGDDRMRELLAPEVQDGDRRMAALPPAGEHGWRSAVTELTATGIDTEHFLDWWQGRLAGGDRRALLTANPEHYLADSRDGTVEIIETIGSGPVRFHLAFADDVPITAPDQDRFPVRLGGTGRLADGTPFLRVMHEFTDTAEGLRIRLTVQFPAGAPEELFTGHQWHFACEFLNWLQAAHDAAQAPATRQNQRADGLTEDI